MQFRPAPGVKLNVQITKETATLSQIHHVKCHLNVLY